MTPPAWRLLAFAAAGFVLLLPTFNALNAEHFENVEPPLEINPPTPPRTPPPTEIPEPEVDPEAEREAPVGGECPPPKAIPKYHAIVEGTPAPQGDTAAFRIAPATILLGVRVTYREFKGSLSLDVRDPSGDGAFHEGKDVLEIEPPESGTRDGAIDSPEPGAWTVAWQAPIGVTGGASIDLVAQVACGGATDGG